MFKQKKLSLGARFGLITASFFLGLLLFFAAIATALVADVKIVVSEDGIQGIVRTILSSPSHVRPNAPVSVSGGDLRVTSSPRRTYQMPRREEPGNVTSSLTDQLIGMFYEEMGDIFGEELTFTQEEFVEMVNDSTVKDYIADKTASLITDYFNDEITTTFDAEEVVQLIEENKELIETITGAPLPEDIADQVGKIFEENEIIVQVEKEGLAGFIQMTGLEIPGLPSAGTGEGDDATAGASGSGFDIRAIYASVQSIGSTKNLLIGIAICLVLMAAIILINCRQLGKGLRRAGYPLIFAGAVYFLLNALTDFLAEVLNSFAADDASLTMIATLIPKLIRYVLSETAVVSIVILIIGCVLFVGGIVLPIVLRAKKSPVSVPTTEETEELAAAVVDDTPVEVLPSAEAEEDPAQEAPAEEAVDAPAPIGE